MHPGPLFLHLDHFFQTKPVWPKKWSSGPKFSPDQIFLTSTSQSPSSSQGLRYSATTTYWTRQQPAQTPRNILPMLLLLLLPCTPPHHTGPPSHSILCWGRHSSVTYRQRMDGGTSWNRWILAYMYMCVHAHVHV